jgi:hypothetical protein
VWSDLEKNRIDGSIKLEHMPDYIPITIDRLEYPDLFNDSLNGRYGEIKPISDDRSNRLTNVENTIISYDISPELRESMEFIESSNKEAMTGSERGYVVHECTLLELASDRALLKFSKENEIKAEKYLKAILEIENERYVPLDRKIDMLGKFKILDWGDIKIFRLLKDVRNIAAHKFVFNLSSEDVKRNLKSLFDITDLGSTYIYDKIVDDFSIFLTHAYGVPCFKIQNKLLTFYYGRNLLDEFNESNSKDKT